MFIQQILTVILLWERMEEEKSKIQLREETRKRLTQKAKEKVYVDSL